MPKLTGAKKRMKVSGDVQMFKKKVQGLTSTGPQYQRMKNEGSSQTECES